MKAFKTIRSQEWWTYKLPPLLAIGYATCSFSSVPLFKISLQLFVILISLVVGAIYVSVINDITDLEEDLASGKSNRVQNIPAKYRWLIPAVCVMIGIAFEYYYYPDVLSCILYLGSWIAFSLYSIKPFRLKNRGIFGVLADACGSHLFTGLLMVSSVSYLTKQHVNWYWFSVIGIWSLCYGLRGILWHQFADRDNDISVNLNTYASKIKPEDFAVKSKYIFLIETIALIFILYQLKSVAAFIGLAIYFLLTIIRIRLYKSRVILIIFDKHERFQILLADYYQMIFPIAVLFDALLLNYLNIFVLIFHILLFPFPIRNAIHDFTKFFKNLLFDRYL